MNLISSSFIASKIAGMSNLSTLFFNSLLNLRGVFPAQLKTFQAVYDLFNH